jgi:CheY-like chemotaxis protein
VSKILVADDNSLIRKTVNAILSSAGHEVLEAGTGQEALDLARREAPDLMLLDYMMPELDGLELLRQARLDPLLAGIPAVMLTAKMGAALEVADLTGVQCVTKPIKSRELLFLVDALLSRGAS